MVGAATVAAVGFSSALFFAEITADGSGGLAATRLAILVASLVTAGAGYALLRTGAPREGRVTPP